MNRAFLVGLALQLAVLLLPPLQGVFHVIPMDSAQWLTVALLAAAPIPICEGAKALGRQKKLAAPEGAASSHRQRAVK